MMERQCPCGDAGVMGVKLEMHADEMRAIKSELWGNGRPGLKERVQVMEQTVSAMKETADAVHADMRKAIFAAVGSLAVMLLAFLVSLAWAGAKRDDTAQVVRETVKAMATADRGN